MLSINMDDVINVINSIKGYLIGFGIVAVLLIVLEKTGCTLEREIRVVE